MNLVRRHHVNAWDPFRDFQELSERLERALYGEREQRERRDAGAQTPAAAVDWSPAINISETDKAYVVKADLPEVKKEDVKVTHENGVLTIEGERRHEKHTDNEKLHRVESNYGRFLRRFTVPENAAEDRIEAAFKDGLLSVTIPKAENKPKAREIQVG